MPHKLFPSFLRPSLLLNITKLKKELTVRSLNQNVHEIYSHVVENPPVDLLALESFTFEFNVKVRWIAVKVVKQ